MRFELQRLSREGLEQNIDALLEIDEGTPGEVWEREHFLMDLPGKWDCSWRALTSQGERTIGFVIASLKEDALHVHRIAVAGTARGLGIGTALLGRVAQCAHKYNVRWITLRVASDNESALRFYHQLGFVRQNPNEDLFDLRVAANELSSDRASHE